MKPCKKALQCSNCSDLFQKLRSNITAVIVSKHFSHDYPEFDINSVIDCDHAYFRHLHKFEESIEGNHIFRAVSGNVHIVYAIDRQNRLVFLRAFKNFNEYKKFLNNKKQVLEIISSAI
jgi:mRNA-degrading endonuclease RelE of RelBE toxin-antitoxin system